MKPEDQVKELATEFAKATDNVKALGEELTGKMNAGEKSIGDLKDQVDNALTLMNEAKTRLDEVEQKQARRGADEIEHQKSLGQQMFESDQFKSFAENPRNGARATLHVKDITSATSAAAGSAGALVTPQQQAGIIAPPNQMLHIRDLIAAGQTNSNSIEYIRETGFTNNAAAQTAEGALKAKSDLQFADETAAVRTLAHYVKASRQILDDAAQLESYIGGRLMYGLKLVEDRQLLNGDGLTGNLKGIVPQATAFADPASLADYTIMDQLRLAMLQAVLAEYPASGHVLNPIDWAVMELSKDAEGRYIIGQPQGTANPTMWGLPVVSTQAMGVGKFLTGAFNMGAQVFDRQQASIAIATENEDDFVKNMITILCEERLALAVYRPEAFITGTLAAKTTP
ncbi:phage major capsid protein [Psychrobacter sp. F1192]|uniref:Phage major capsid protein n=1 Tax=Psychrobacter coccoides TaxID=2818440 RepID=A0ABS3NJX9_9GAMM|nr:phage major capsid protein [Psychrobacter coccoides]MBO1529643.1 phage major capsid protein [Psychrobacter coccoides]